MQKKRPSFVEIIEIIDSVLVDCLVSDPIANKFWKEKFLGKQTVPWSVFSSSFAKLLEVTIDNESTGWVCLKKIAAFPNNDPGEKENEVVNLEQFAHLINWFGPIPATKRENFVKGLKDLMKNEWFHGDIEKGESEDLLKNYKSGYFLVRTSKTTPDKPFTISKHSKKDKINHQRIAKAVDGTLTISIVGKKETKVITQKDGNLEKLISAVKKPLELEKAVPGSKYRGIFTKTQSEGYLPDESESSSDDDSD